MMGDHQGPTTDDGLTKPDPADERTELARQRTEASANRTVLANERTFTAWLRTGLSAIALGLAVPRLLTTAESAYVGDFLALILIALGIFMAVLAACRYCRVAEDLEEAGLELTPAWIAMVIVVGLSIVGVLAVVMVLIG
jgi:putative membrane protein